MEATNAVKIESAVYQKWTFPDCWVHEVDFDGNLHAFEVYAKSACAPEDGELVVPYSIDEMRASIESLNAGNSPIGAWENNGRLVGYSD